MPVPTVTMIDDEKVRQQRASGMRFAAGSEPLREVKLGLRPSKVQTNRAVMLHKFFEATTPPPPKGPGYGKKAPNVLRQMYANDQYGCCVIAGKTHGVGIRSANDSDGSEVIGNDSEVVNEYHRLCGPGDNGCYIPAVLDAMVSGGLSVAGTKRHLDGWASIDTSNTDLIKAVLIALGGFTIGFNVPSEWMNTGDMDIWDTPSRYRFVGGHDVFVYDYDERGVYVSTWGGTRIMTWRAFQDRNIVTEAYAELGQDWYNNDQLAPSGFKVAELQAALAAAKAGNVPAWEPADPPAPPLPPGPPPPPAPVVPPSYAGTLQFRLPLLGTITGTVQLAPIPQGTATLGRVAIRGRLDGSEAVWEDITKLVAQLALDIASHNWAAVLPDILAILSALGIMKTPQAANQTAELKVSWFKVVMDLVALGRAVAAKDPAAIVAALITLAADFGLNLG